ncbi:conserved hypothetical protein [Aeropyrum pernix]|uniref:Calcineurin-like phosphoesterase domain-containing protein n=1 Tax=Aeropyrum pernix TaxID=56636 RepID=A0A401H7H4_AERPX|nr:metallophosphoesterase family protein [Aeropyrum pernix]GBF08395.1 conserved hypothetical protein [Aeropyrum pernix]
MRVLVVSDVHGNLPALEAVLEAAGRFDEVLVLGDLVDYGPWPGEVIDVLRGLGARIVRGNHDHAVGYGVDCRCGEETHWLSVWFRENITQKLLGDAEKRFLAELPLELRLDGVLAVHGCPRNPLYCYLYPWMGRESLLDGLRRPGVRLGRQGAVVEEATVLVGHTHVQFHLTLDGRRVVNPGSAGQPRDGDRRAGYAMLDLESGRVELARVEYPVERVVRRLVEMGVPEPYMTALKTMLLEARTPSRPPGV